MTTMLDWSQVKNKVTNFKDMLSLSKDSEAFIYYCLDRILKLDIDDSTAAITDGGDDRGIDSIYIQNTQDRKIVHLFQMKTYDQFDKAKKKEFPSNEADKILSFVSDLLSKATNMKDSCNALLYSKVEDVWDALEENTYDFEIHLCSNGLKLPPKKLEAFRQSLNQYQVFSIVEHDLESLAKIELGSHRSNRSMQIRLLEEQNFERTDGYVRGLIGSVHADELVGFLDNETCPGQIDETLFEENIRLYLGEKNEVNTKILQSALSDNPVEFWYLNNGITIVCDSYTYQPKLASPVVAIYNPQIVNGGQTSHSLFEARKRNPEKTPNIKVLVKIIETKDREFRNKIAEATNSQTPIRSRDLRSNDVIQLKLEEALQAHGYYYDRKKNLHSDKPYSQRIDGLKAGQIIMAYYMREPDKAKAQSDKIFGEYYELVFDPHTLSAEKLLTVHKLYEAIENRKKLAQQKMRAVTKKDYSEQWIIEGIYHVLYATALLCERDGIDLENYTEAKKRIDEAIKNTGDYVKSQKRASAYRIFRSARTKVAMRSIQPAQMELSLDKEKAA